MLAPLGARVAPLWLQLPASFGPQRLGELLAWLDEFAERAIAFHKSADEIAAAARRKDIQGVTANLSRTLVQCTGCHATYRQDIIGGSSHDRLVEPFIGSHH